MEGPIFRQLGDKGRPEAIPRLQVLIRSSPENERILVARLSCSGCLVWYRHAGGSLKATSRFEFAPVECKLGMKYKSGIKKKFSKP